MVAEQVEQTQARLEPLREESEYSVEMEDSRESLRPVMTSMPLPQSLDIVYPTGTIQRTSTQSNGGKYFFDPIPEHPVFKEPFFYVDPSDGRQYATDGKVVWSVNSAYHDLRMGHREPPPCYGYHDELPKSIDEHLDRALREADDLRAELYFTRQVVVKNEQTIFDYELAQEDRKYAEQWVADQLIQKGAMTETLGRFYQDLGDMSQQNNNSGPATYITKEKGKEINNNPEIATQQPELQQLVKQSIREILPDIIKKVQENIKTPSYVTSHSKRTENPPKTNTEQVASSRRTQTSKRSRTSSNKYSGSEESLNLSSEDSEEEENETKRYRHKGCSYKTFQDCKPYEFKGTEGGIATLHWLEKMESVIAISKCAKKDQVLYASNSFKNEALEWWNSIISAKGRRKTNAMDWKEFRAKVKKKFCPKTEKEQAERKFLEHRMVGTNDREYTTKFFEYARLAPHLAKPESILITRYIYGLVPEIRDLVKVVSPKTIESTVELTGTMTAGLIRNIEEKKKVESSIKSKPEAKRFSKNFGQKGLPFNNPSCKTCGRRHSGKCVFETPFCNYCKVSGHSTENCFKKKGITCFSCGELGHISTNCPKFARTGRAGGSGAKITPENKKTVRAFVMNANQAERTPDVITGTFLLNNVYAKKQRTVI
ncbi:hypothetical protein L1987_20158 [Smallanthus sonchifolius]|uniref:Uncharacterized protein n=1 Tax=Smallanthus sonchifolius TaxID=185202 RepID=A0ACB9ISV8_9ASTR|nr:hypothetical protein L1987_20158 [Smallanthus sonchifolius]